MMGVGRRSGVGERNSKGDTDIKNRVLDSVGESEDKII